MAFSKGWMVGKSAIYAHAIHYACMADVKVNLPLSVIVFYTRASIKF